MCGTLFLVEDDKTERDRQLIGYPMTHLIQVTIDGVITYDNQNNFNWKEKIKRNFK